MGEFIKTTTFHTDQETIKGYEHLFEYIDTRQDKILYRTKYKLVDVRYNKIMKITKGVDYKKEAEDFIENNKDKIYIHEEPIDMTPPRGIRLGQYFVNSRAAHEIW